MPATYHHQVLKRFRDGITNRIYFLLSVHSTWLSQFTQFEFTRMVKPSNENSLSSDLPKSLSHFSWAL